MKHTCGKDGDPGAVAPLDGICRACVEEQERLGNYVVGITDVEEPKVEPLSLICFEYIHKIARRICPRLDHEEIAMDLWTKCWQEKRMPTYTQVKNHCLDALRRNKSETKKHVNYGALNLLGERVAVELPQDVVDSIIQRADLTSNERTAIYQRFYANQSAIPQHFESACVKLQRAWKEYCNERDEQE